MKKTLYTNPSERTPRILVDSFAVRAIVKKLDGAEFVDDTNYPVGEEFIYMITPMGIVVHYEHFRKGPQVSLIGAPSKIEDLEKILSERLFAPEYAQTTLK